MRYRIPITVCILAITSIAFGVDGANMQPLQAKENASTVQFLNAADSGFSPEASGIENTKALQRAVDQTGTIVVSRPGVYNIAGTVFIGSNTSLIFGNNVFIKKVNEEGPFSQVFLNKGALSRIYDHNITIEGLSLIVNNVDIYETKIYGLRGQLGLFYIKDLSIKRFRCVDLGKAQFGIQVCAFEDICIDDVTIKGDKDGIHLGRGKRFTISNGIFETFDDAIALNAHDYTASAPELGWIEDGVVEKCYDLNAEKTTGFFCRILAGGWVDWYSGMEIRKSDTVVSNGRLYRCDNKPDGKVYHSITQPSHNNGTKVLDGINWVAGQTDIVYTAGVKHIVFRDISLEKPRTGFAVHFDNDAYSRSYYPGAIVPKQEQLSFENIRVVHNQSKPFLMVSTPIDTLTIANSSLRNNPIVFRGDKSVPDYQKTTINIFGCIFNYKGVMDLLTNSVPDKSIFLKTFSNIELNDGFSAKVNPGGGKITVESDLTGLKK